MKRANHDNHDRQHHARFMLEKRQRLPLTTSADDDDEDTAVSTVPVARTTVRASTTAAGRQPLTTSEVEEEDEPTSIVRGGRVPLSTSSSASASIGRGRPAATTATTSSTSASSAAPATSTEEEVVVTVTPTPIPRTTSSTAATAARTTSTTSSSSSVRSVATTSSTSTSPTSATSGLVNGAASPNGQNGASSNEGGGSNAGAIAGAVIGVIAVLAIAAFFGLRWRKKKQRQAEDTAIFSSSNNPGSGGTFAAFGAKRQSAAAAGYNRHLDSFEDLHSNDKDLPHPNDNDNDNEKTPSSGMAGYGTLALNASTNNINNPNRNSFAGRGNAFTSPSHTTLLGQSDYNNSTTNVNNEYPPTTGMGMQTQAFRSRPPSATMMAHPVEAYNASATHLPAHQDQALSNALRNSVNLGNGSKSGFAAGVPLPHSPAVSNAEYAQAAASRQSMNTAATAAAAAALGTASSSSNFQQQEQEEQAGPFSDPSHEGKVYIVTRIFEPSMPDELVFFPGDRIQIVVTYDDGWCLGCNLDSPNRDGQAPARGVFPRDCVEEMAIPESGPAGLASRPVSNAQSIHEQGLSPANFDEDQPLNRGGASSLQRAPTLPPLDIGNSSRFSMGSSSAGPQSAIQQQQARQSQRLSKRQSKLVPESDADDEMEDAYGGVLAGGPTPTSTSFPPEIQVSQSPAVTTGPNRASHNFGSSQNIADYAAQLGETHNNNDTNNNNNNNNNRSSKRLSTLDEENSQIIDDFPSTPRTAQAARSPNLYEGASPAGSARLSIAGIPKSSSASSIKRTSSLIASKDADLFLALGDALGKNKN